MLYRNVRRGDDTAWSTFSVVVKPSLSLFSILQQKMLLPPFTSLQTEETA